MPKVNLKYRELQYRKFMNTLFYPCNRLTATRLWCCSVPDNILLSISLWNINSEKLSAHQCSLSGSHRDGVAAGSCGGNFFFFRLRSGQSSAVYSGDYIRYFLSAVGTLPPGKKKGIDKPMPIKNLQNKWQETVHSAVLPVRSPAVVSMLQ